MLTFFFFQLISCDCLNILVLIVLFLSYPPMLPHAALHLSWSDMFLQGIPHDYGDVLSWAHLADNPHVYAQLNWASSDLFM